MIVKNYFILDINYKHLISGIVFIYKLNNIEVNIHLIFLCILIFVTFSVYIYPISSNIFLYSIEHNYEFKMYLYLYFILFYKYKSLY